MAYLTQKKCARMNEETLEQISELLRKTNHKYESESHVIRCAVIQLYRKEFDGGKQDG